MCMNDALLINEVINVSLLIQHMLGNCLFFIVE